MRFNSNGQAERIGGSSSIDIGIPELNEPFHLCLLLDERTRQSPDQLAGILLVHPRYVQA